MPTTQPPELIQTDPNRAFNPVKAAASSNVNTSQAPNVIDSVLIGPGRDRVLLAGQSTGSQNGLYVPQEGGSFADDTIAANASTTKTVTANRLVYVSVTGTVTVTGANGTVTAGNPGFLSAASTTLTVTGGDSGGVASYKTTVTLARTTDADADGEFLPGKVVDVRQGANAGVWVVGAVAALPITNTLAIPFTRITQAGASRAAAADAYTSTAPTVIPLGFAFALTTSIGALTCHLGAVHALI